MPKPKPARRRGRAPVAASRLDAFFAALADTGSVSQAAERTRLSRSTLYQLRDSDEDFARRWRAAMALGVERLEDDAIVRAREGVPRPVFRAGRQVGTVTQHDNRLLQFLLKAHKPETYGDRPRAAALPADLARRLAAAEKRMEGRWPAPAAPSAPSTAGKKRRG